MEMREKSKKIRTDSNDTDDEQRGAEPNASRASGKDGGKLKTKVNLERILQEIQDFRKECNCQLEDIKNELNKTNQRIKEAEDRIDEVGTRLLTEKHAKGPNSTRG